MMTSGPLEGVRVLDLSRLIPGAYCSLILSELGADVIKVEDLGAGDYLRFFPPQRAGLGGAFYALNRGKRSICVNLKRPAGRELLLRLAGTSRVVIEGFRPGVLERLGLGYEALCAANPELVLCSITGYGQDGPLGARAGHDINYLALAGVLATGGAPGGRPCLPGIQVADVAGGALWGAVRILAALHGGGGAHLDISMTEGAMAFLLPWLGELAFGGEVQRRGEGMLNGGKACYNTYATADPPHHVAVGALEPKFWAALRQALGQAAEGSDPVAPAARQAELKAELDRTFAAATRDTWAQRLQAVDACVEPVLELEELADHPQHRHRGVFYELHDPTRGPVSQLRLPVDGRPASTPAPRQGEHTEQVLAEAGLSPDEIAALRADGAVR
jgi:crotonobetainyl-CoA:carnitine CoA-transferase CaiB-like acyl-CoA transferase